MASNSSARSTMNLISSSFLFLLLCRSAFSAVISESSARLPMSLSTVISDLEAEGISQLVTACLISSRGVTQLQKAELLEKIIGADITVSSKAFGTDNGIAVAQPPTSPVHEVASTAVACGGTIIYYPSAEDLSRGEGLFDSLAPAMERVLMLKSKTSEDDRKSTSLIVVVDDDSESTKFKLEQACESMLANLISDEKVSVLEDIFDSVLYVAPSKVVEILTSELKKSPAEATAAVAETVNSDLSTSSPANADLTTPKDLAAARKLGPAARNVLVSAMQRVKDATKTEGGTSQYFASFGSLCDAAISQALEELETGATSAGCAALLSTASGKTIRDNLESELYEQLGDIFDEQLQQLQLASFDEFKQSLSRLRVSPNLGAEMEESVSKSLTSFSDAAKKLLAKKSPWSFSHVKTKYHRMLNEYCTDRLMAARASGQYRPLPRKGVQVGLHWLLPKPFGNDFRQEPWMVHATDNLVYVPQDKITDVNPADVQTGDWRSKVVPSPVGNDMLYMQ